MGSVNSMQVAKKRCTKATIRNNSQAIAHANFHPHVNFFIMFMWHFFFPSMYFYLRSQCLMLTFVVIRLFHSVLCCFSVFWTISDIVFKADILPTNDFFERQVSCASPTNPFLRQLQCRSDIEYEYWKWSTLRYITSLPCKTKPRVSKLSKSRCNPRWTSKNGWYEDHKLLAHARMVGLKKLPVKQGILLLWPFLCWMVLWLAIYPKFALACHFYSVISWFIACTLRTKVISKVLE